MNEFQQNLYSDLMALCNSSDAFYYVDQSFAGNTYRIFSYRLATYTDFQKPNARECRGHTFHINDAGEVIELVALPMQKFHNIGENPDVTNLDFSKDNIQYIMDKLDGSLISTVKIGQEFTLKSKTSLNSEQARDAWALLNTPEYKHLFDYCRRMVCAGNTVNFEWMSPTNRIVIGYEKPMLRVLNVRNNANGCYVARDIVELDVGRDYMVNIVPVPEDSEKWIKSIENMKGIEGFVIVLKSGLWVKQKVIEYCILHKTKDGINSDRKLFEACIMETSDDLRGLFSDDLTAITRITEMEFKVSKIYNHLSTLIDNFYNENKHLDRKSFAIKGTAELSQYGVFGLAMNKYVGKECDLKSFMIKNYKSYGIKDDIAANPDD